jgi:hypothetical protein
MRPYFERVQRFDIITRIAGHCLNRAPIQRKHFDLQFPTDVVDGVLLPALLNMDAPPPMRRTATSTTRKSK